MPDSENPRRPKTHGSIKYFIKLIWDKAILVLSGVAFSHKMYEMIVLLRFLVETSSFFAIRETLVYFENKHFWRNLARDFENSIVI